MGSNLSPSSGSFERLADVELRASRRSMTRLTLALMEDLGYYIPSYDDAVRPANLLYRFTCCHCHR